MFTSSKNMSLIKGMGIGLAVGTAAVVAGSTMMSKSTKKTCKKNAMKCMRTVEDMLGNMTMMVK